MTADHPFERGPNPRSHNSCVHCGRIPERHPEPPPEREGTRDPEFERQLTEAACSGVIDPAALNDFAERRAHPGPVREFSTRDFCRDGLEEGADWRNYLVWDVQQIDADLAAGRIEEETSAQCRELDARALQHIAIAFTLTAQSRALRR